MSNHGTKALLAGALSMLALTAGAAEPAAALPAIHKSAGVEYLTGGVGRDESQAIKAVAAHWPLTLEFGVKSGSGADFAADVRVTVRDAKGHAALAAASAGPFLLARLPAGDYNVEATLAGKTLHEHVRVHAGQPTKAVFLWPAGTGESQAGHS